tara:strand:+ start:1035 stop:1796 length:762 start_codon:yes stop_codon:yes gene_type:complete
MTSPETFIAFAAIMLVIALIGAAIDWVGTPLKHRKFVPKAYRFPDERLFRNESLHHLDIPSPTLSSESTSFKEELVTIEAQDSSQDGDAIDVLTLEALIQPDTKEQINDHDQLANYTPAEIAKEKISIEEQDEITFDVREDLSSPKKHEAALRLSGWKPGGYIYNLTQDGREPSPATVKTRYWKNVGAASGSAIFGTQNIERMKEGKPPQRRNYKSGKIETMRISPKSFEESEGQIPIPYWPSNAVDPFGAPL